MNEPIRNFFVQAEEARRVFFGSKRWLPDVKIDPAQAVFKPVQAQWKAQGAADFLQRELQRRVAKGIALPQPYVPEGWGFNPPTQKRQSTPQNLAHLMHAIARQQAEFYAAKKVEDEADERARQAADARRNVQSKLQKLNTKASPLVGKCVEALTHNTTLGAPKRPTIEPQQAEAYVGAFIELVQQHEQAVRDRHNLLGTYFDPDEPASADYLSRNVEFPKYESGECYSDFATWVRVNAEAFGFEYLGNGHYSIAFGINGDDRWIIKWGIAGGEDACYDWLRWAAQHQDLHGVPTIAALRRVRDQYGEGYYVCLMESCEGIERNGYGDARGAADRQTREICDLSLWWSVNFDGKTQIPQSSVAFYMNSRKTLEQRAVVETLLYFLKSQHENGWRSGINDLHSNNIMLSTLGNRIVVTDPMSDTSSSWEHD